MIGEATISGFWLWPNIIAVALSASPLVVVIIGVGYILNSHQIVHNCYIGMTRVMVAMSLDRLLPEWVSKVDDKRHTPANAHWAYFIASIPVILLYNLYPGWVGLTLGVTFACGYVFVITCLAGALLPYRAKDVYESSPGAAYKVGGIPLVTVLGVIGFILGTVFLLMFMLDPRLGLASPMAYQIVFGVLAVSAIWYFISKSMQKSKGIDVDYAFKEIPPE